MTIEKIKKALAKPDVIRHHKNFSVLIPLIKIEDSLYLIFEQRAFTLNSQPGEICFPGGKKEEFETPERTAIRETAEELNISENRINILGDLSPLITPFKYKINIYVGEIVGVNFDEIPYNKMEVHKLIKVPFNYLLTHKEKVHNLQVNIEMTNDFPYEKIPKGKNYDFKSDIYKVYFYQYDTVLIWGITAKILKKFLTQVKGSFSNNT